MRQYSKSGTAVAYGCQARFWASTKEQIVPSIKIMLLAAGAALGSLTTSAQATTCALSAVTGATACAGYVSGNIFDSSGSDPATVTSLLSNIGFDASGINFTTFYAAPGRKLDLTGQTSLSFSAVPALFGKTYIGVHWGGQGGGQSAVFELDLASPVQTITIVGQNPGGSSNATLFFTTPYSAAVPEPATWAMMLTGLGMIGFGVRRKVSVAYA